MGNKFAEESEQSERKLVSREDKESLYSEYDGPKAQMNESKPTQQEIETDFALNQ